MSNKIIKANSALKEQVSLITDIQEAKKIEENADPKRNWNQSVMDAMKAKRESSEQEISLSNNLTNTVIQNEEKKQQAIKETDDKIRSFSELKIKSNDFVDIEGLTKAGVEVNRKMLSEIAINDPKMFSEFVKVAKDGKAGKITKSTEVIGREVTINGTKATKKTEEKKTVKKEAKEETVDYSKMTVAELKEVAASKNISVAGLKKAEIIEALTK